MNCEANQELFSEYLDRTLVPELKDSLEEHLKRCPTCNRELQKITATVKLLSRLPELPAPPDFLVTVRQRIDRTPAWRQILAPVAWAFSPGASRALALAASFLFVFSVAFFFGRHYQTPKSSPMLAAKSSLPAEAWTPPEDPFGGPEWAISLAEEKPRALSVSTGFHIPDALEVEYAASRSLPAGAFPYQTPTELVIALIKADPELRYADLYPLPQGALALAPDFLYQITIADSDFALAPQIFLQSGHQLPPSLGQAQQLYKLRIRRLASPLSPP